jgi:hypothetical protein
MILGVGYGPHMFGSGPWYRHALGIPRRSTLRRIERNYPFNVVALNEQALLWPARLSPGYLARGNRRDNDEAFTPNVSPTGSTHDS